MNTIAARATAQLDMRSTDVETLNQLADQARETIEQSVGTGLTVEIEVLGERPAGERSLSDPLIQLAGETLRWLGIEPQYRLSSTDANIPISLNIPTVCVGVTKGEYAHTLQERLSIPPIGYGLAQLGRLCVEGSLLVRNL